MRNRGATSSNGIADSTARQDDAYISYRCRSTLPGPTRRDVF
jgi:hypothetical protein